MMGEELFQDILVSCPEKKIVGFCKKLIKKCSFSRSADAENLCHLAYCLYICGYEDKAINVCAFTHDAPFPGRSIYNVWDYLLFMWGLEAYILKKRGQTAKADLRIKAMDKIWMTPLEVLLPKETAEEQNKRELGRRERFKYPDILDLEEIRRSETERGKNEYRLTALFHMIGYGTTGLFPNLAAHCDELEKDIADYVDILNRAYK